jgi:hypothetical protein
MAHRCTYGDILLEVFVGQINSDQTEGRGRMIDHSHYDNAQDAHKSIKNEGVMGVGDGDVVRRVFYTCDADNTGDKCSQILVTNDKIYSGYAARGGSPSGGFDKDGWLPKFSPLANDPDYKTWLRLNEKFGKK